MTIAVTGATGHLGGLVITHLLRRGTPAEQVVALVRDVDRAGQLAALGVQVRHFDFDQPDGLAAALADVDALLLVSGTAIGRRAAQHKAVIDAAIEAGVGKLVYTSAPHVEASINPVAPEHKATEEALAASGIRHVILRNGWYHENYLRDLETVAHTGVLLTAAGEGRVASAARGELAEAAAVVLAGSLDAGTITLTGDVAWTQEDLAADLAAVLGREVQVQHVSSQELADTLAAAGVDAGMAGFAVGVDAAIAAGELGEVNGELARLIGRPTAPLIETLRSAGR